MADDGNNEEKNICVICLERLNEGTIGAATPCGHCFHEVCFAGWRHSQNRTTPQSPWYEQIQPCKCPMCNKEAAGFYRIYLDLDALGSGAGAGGDDDDSSLSSEEDEEDDAGGNDDRPVREDDDESQAAGSEARNTDSEHGQLDDNDRGNQLSQKSPPQNESQPPSANVPEGVEVIEIDDDDNDDANAEDGDEALRQKSAKCVTQKNYRSRAKQLKRRIKVLERQRSEQYSELLEVQEKYGACRTKLAALEGEVAALSARNDLHERERESTAVQLARLSREKCELTASLEQANADRDKADRRLDEVRKEHDRELKKAQANSMSEVQKMLHDHPHLIRENRDLKQLNEKYRSKLRELQSQPGLPAAAKDAGAGTPSLASSQGSARQRHAPVPSSAVHAARQFSAMDARHQMEQKRKDKDDRNAQSKADMLGKVSAHAARFTSRPAGERKPHPLQSLSLLDGNGDDGVGERHSSVGSNKSTGCTSSNPKRPPNQLLMLSMPIQKRSKSSGHFQRSTSSLLPKPKMR